MNPARATRWLTVLGIPALALACASVPKDAGFHDVQEAIRARTGHEAIWTPQVPDKESLEERIGALLGRELSDRDAVEVALLRNHRLQASFEGLGIAGAELMQAGVIRNPILLGEIRFPDRPFELSLTQTILDLIQLPRRKRMAAANFEAAKLRAAGEVVAIITDVRSVFFSLQGAEQVRALRARNVEAARARAELALRQHEAGTISELSLESEQAQLEQAKLDRARSEMEAVALRERLNALMGTWGADTSWKIAPALPQPPITEPGMEGLESLAVSQRLDLALARQEAEASARAVGLARLTSIGDLTAGIHLEREPEGTRTTGPALEVPIPIFDRGRPTKNRAEAVLRQNLERFAALAVEARAEVRAARERLVAERSRYEYYRDVVLPRRRRITAYSQKHYNFMLLGPFQLVMARQDELEAERDSLEALKDYWLARVELERAVGGGLPTGPTSVSETASTAPAGAATTLATAPLVPQHDTTASTPSDPKE